MEKSEKAFFSQTNKQTNKQTDKAQKRIWSRHRSGIGTRVHTYFETNVQKIDLYASLQVESVESKGSVGNSNDFNQLFVIRITYFDE